LKPTLNYTTIALFLLPNKLHLYLLTLTSCIMKQIIFVLSSVLILMAACKKDMGTGENNPLNASKEYHIQNGILAFPSVNAYRQLLEGGQQRIAQFLSRVQKEKNYIPLQGSTRAAALLNRVNRHTANRLAPAGDSLVDSEIADILDDAFFSTIVNEDGLVIIGDYIFIIDIVTEKCYAMHTSWLNGANGNYFYNLIYNGDSRNNYVFGNTGRLGLAVGKKRFAATGQKMRGKRGVPSISISRSPHFPYSKDDRREYYIAARLKYVKLAVYFNLKAKYTPHTVGWPLPKTGWAFEDLKTKFWRFKPKCWNERLHPLETVGPYTVSGGWFENMWQSSRGLSKYHARFQFWFTKKIDGQNVTITTGLMEIKAGY
jgi:hypothetical protein